LAGANSGSPLILIVDPEQRDREAASEVMHRAGYSTVCATSGEEAVAIAKRERPRVVVLEVCLPEISGYEVCRELREAFGEQLSIVFVSGTRTESYDRVGGLLLGADDYLVKPFAADELLARVRRLVHDPPQLTSGVASNLTPREQEVLQLVAQGHDQKEIASRLSISPKTVGTHLEHIFSKLGVRSLAQAVALVYREDLSNRKPPRSLSIAPLTLPAGDFLWDCLSFCANGYLFG
jgi:DNA-binding NarL/FixJ family response regulator